MPKTSSKPSAPSSTRKGAGTVSIQAVLDVLRTDGPSSQAAIARKTGLAPATINKIVQALHSEGTADFQWINGREALVELVPNHGAIISVSISPEGIHAVVFDFARRRRADLVLDAAADAPGGAPDTVIDMVRRLALDAGLSDDKLAGVAIAIQAPVDRSTGAIAVWAANRLPRWRNVAIADTLGKAFGVPVVVDNDANLAALAEWTWGAGKGADCFLYVNCSKGIGGGLVVDGKLHRGGNGMALEIGHIVVEQTGPVCFCGSRGCLSTLASERSILQALHGSDSTRTSLLAVIDSAQDGDPACKRVLYEAGRNLGRALANMAKIIAPSVIAVGGVLAGAGPLVFDSLRSSIEDSNVFAWSSSMQFRPALIAADVTVLGGVAAVMGELGQGVSELPAWMLAPTGK